MAKNRQDIFIVAPDSIKDLYYQFAFKPEEFYELGDCGLYGPLKYMYAEGSSDGVNYSLNISINKSRKKKNKKDIFPNNYFENKGFKKINDNDNNIIYKRKNEKYIVSETDEELDISIGYEEKIKSGVINSATSFADIIFNLCNFVSESIVEIYKNNNLKIPKRQFIISSCDLEEDEKIEEIEKINTNQKYENLEKRLLVKKQNIGFSQIGAQKKAIEELKLVSHYLSSPDYFEYMGIEPSKGILLHGPPGCGKTLMAKAVASQAKANFYNINFTSFASKWYSEAESNLSKIFEIAKKKDKAILFFDEIDSIAISRKNIGENSRKLVNVLLENLDGLSSQNSVLVIAATNEKDMLDSAILRPGRFDKHIEVPLPNYNGRKDIFKIHRNKRQKKAKKKSLFKRLDYDKLAKETDNYSGADIAEVVRRSLETKVKQIITDNKLPDKNKPYKYSVKTSDILKEIEIYDLERDLKKENKKIGFS